MSSYKYDHLLNDQFEKVALLAGLAARAAPMLARAGTAIATHAPSVANAGQKVMQYGRNLGGAVKEMGFRGTVSNIGRGMFGMAPAEGASAGAKMIHGAGQGLGMAQGAYGVAQAFKPPPPPPPPPQLQGGGRAVTASLRENQARYLFKGAGGNSLGERALHIAPYAAWIGSQLLEDSHPRLSKGLNLGAYGLYAGMAGREALRNPSERITSGIDAAALTAMGLADLARMRRKSINPAEGH
jgi:hypothetical protein